REQVRLDADLTGRIVEPVGADGAQVRRRPREPRLARQPDRDELRLGRCDGRLIDDRHSASLASGFHGVSGRYGVESTEVPVLLGVLVLATVQDALGGEALRW